MLSDAEIIGSAGRHRKVPNWFKMIFGLFRFIVGTLPLWVAVILFFREGPTPFVKGLALWALAAFTGYFMGLVAAAIEEVEKG